mgnify:FL=1
MELMKKIIEFVKKETLLTIAFVLAVVSAHFVKPSMAYVEYIDVRVLGILLSLMLVMAGLREAGLFDAIGVALLKKTKTSRGLSIILVLLCFFFSMLITNDVALITFVPFAIFTLEKCNQKNLIIPVVVLQTLAANLGSMTTPVGNPQNLYIYQVSAMSMGEFSLTLLPYTLGSLILLIASVFILSRDNQGIEAELDATHTHKKDIYIHSLFFVLCLLVVLKILPFWLPLLIIFVYLLIFDRTLVGKADYSLLLIFVFLFIFTGNLSRIPAINEILTGIVSGHEVITSVVASQFISNVPATLLLSGFTDNYKALLIGVNLGGLGTLIASMASLISYKQIQRYDNSMKGNYFAIFTVLNVVYLGIMMIVYYAI